MKRILLPLTLAGFCAVALAQTNQPAKPKTDRGPTVITADTWQMEWESRKLVYSGHVKVNDPQMQLTCEFLTALFRTNTPNLEVQTITAEKNVVVEAVDWEGRTNFATADKLVYTYSVADSVTNQTLELSGHAALTNSVLGSLQAEPITVDLVKAKVYGNKVNTTINSTGTKAISEALQGKDSLPATNQPVTSPK